VRRSIYYVNPMADFPTYFGSENFAARGFARTTYMADLTIPTLAALTPSSFNVRLCDENITSVDFDTTADFVALTGKVTQFRRLVRIAEEFRARKKIVLIGGPYASLSPEVLRPHCDILVRGEIEELAPKLFDDLNSGTWAKDYEGGRPDLSLAPIPRWDLYPNDHALLGTVQTSRGCPFECEFCDVIQYLGRKQRHKPGRLVLAELDVLYRHAYRSVFLADDNFTVFRNRAKELLVLLRDWNRARTNGRVNFSTQVSIDSAKDEELLTLCSEAGLTTVFVGIETPNTDSLRNIKKRQNLNVDMVELIARFFDHGISVTGGMIVGFETDGYDIFERQYDFAMASGIPIFTLGALVAPAATPLHARLKQQGRLRDAGSEVAADPWTTNIVHPKIPAEELTRGLRWLANNLYSPQAFGDRLLTFIAKFGKRRDPYWCNHQPNHHTRSVDRNSLAVLDQLRGLGPDEATMWNRVVQAATRKPETMSFVFYACIQYMQIRHMYDTGQFWDVQLASTPAPAEPVTSLTPLRIAGTGAR